MDKNLDKNKEFLGYLENSRNLFFKGMLHNENEFLITINTLKPVDHKIENFVNSVKKHKNYKIVLDANLSKITKFIDATKSYEGNLSKYEQKLLIKYIDFLEIVMTDYYGKEQTDNLRNILFQIAISVIQNNEGCIDDLFKYVNLKKDNIPKKIFDSYKAQNKIKDFIKAYNFFEADSLYKSNQSLISIEWYENYKSEYIQKYFKENFKIKINKEQAKALSLLGQNVLVTARAGSGKTRTIACRTILAIEKENIKPEEIIILAFNRKAAEEIRDRITKDFKYNKFIPKNARTFHSLAHNIEQPTADLIWDDPNESTQKELSNFISKLSHKQYIWDNLKDLLYKFFKNDNNEEIDKYWSFDSNPDRYLYLRNLKYITLNGEKVKSNGEKWIADFLFEHNIKYQYEKLLGKVGDKLYRPDFKIYKNKKEYYIEHWGIDEFDKNKQVPDFWLKKWDDYHNEMLWKRKYFQYNKKQELIETSINDMTEGREKFELILKSRLEEKGIQCIKLSFEEIIKRLHYKHKDSMAPLYINFIQTARRAEISPKEIDEKLSQYHLSDKNTAFVKMANYIYKQYEKALEKENKLDFDMLLKKSIEKINKTNGNCEIFIGKQKIKVKDIKMLLIDEFQDFSKLFYKLIISIKKYNPNLKLYCVGDDWQAINGFAGSDLKYFENFKNIFNNSETVETSNLLYNYRSGKSIVGVGNRIMYNRGVPAKAYNTNLQSKIICREIDDINYCIDGTNIIDSNFIYDSDTTGDNNKRYFDIQHRYFKACYQIISQQPQKSFIIMARNNNICSNKSLNEFENKLQEKLNADNYRVSSLKVNTVHKFKGAEADIVIILECDNSHFPQLHPNNEYMQIFGRGPNTVINEERRLFYVAITRAKERVYCLYERGNITDFLKNISK